jgi:hypothetical protein
LAATVYARFEQFRWLRGQDLLSWYDAPLVQEPPPYRHVFCGKCGSPLPICREEFGFVEIPVGLMSPVEAEHLAYEMFTPGRHRWLEHLGSVPAFAAGGPPAGKVLLDLVVTKASSRPTDDQ